MQTIINPVFLPLLPPNTLQLVGRCILLTRIMHNYFDFDYLWTILVASLSQHDVRGGSCETRYDLASHDQTGQNLLLHPMVCTFEEVRLAMSIASDNQIDLRTKPVYHLQLVRLEVLQCHDVHPVLNLKMIQLPP